MKIAYLFFSSLLSITAFAQPSQAVMDSINAITQTDYENMLGQLGLKRSALRPGPSGNPSAPNAANRFEDKVNKYNLPNPLIFKDGRRVKGSSDWNRRRQEIIDEFENEIYGRLPSQLPSVKWVTISATDTVVGDLPIKEKRLKGIVDNTAYPAIKVEIELLLATPAKIEGAVPVVIEFGWIQNPFNRAPIQPIGLGSSTEPSWKEQLIMRGWGYAIMVPHSVQADHGAGLTQGIIGLVNKGKHRKPHDWGALRAWAWGASRTIDYLETDKDVDSKRLAIEGLSRYGKAAIVAMAFEPRLSLGFIGSSGAGGVKIMRRVFGEQVENLCSSAEYHWFAGNFIKYASKLTPDNLPVDAHELVALCAPRPVFISSGSPRVEGQWVDAKGMFLGGVHAGAVYRLLGKKDLDTTEFPALGTALTNGEIAYRQHAGGHSTGPNWSTWIAWACRYWGDCKY
ncbi:glucuronyl esterase domain-containing protein [Chryseosolibacter indicus]|uniref:Acetylxylan esterase n=1 Tax=Chryseosolibacter indicus TaxID=2782351 RepID=A0ABS5VWM1_9BACT|nr:acetylxylan esterase [Chryseosolibacter indicus]MBT1705822.1 acetylxylan esterase [Chryseosolibacter indicus]